MCITLIPKAIKEIVVLRIEWTAEGCVVSELIVEVGTWIK